MFGLFKSKLVKAKIDSNTAQILELEATKKRLEMERDQMKLSIDNNLQRESMKVELAVHKHTLKLQEETAVFEREKKVWATEKQEIIDRAARERSEFEDRMKKDFELKIQESVTLTKLESQQKIKQTELDKSRELNALQTVHTEELSRVKTELAEQYYQKLTAAFQEIQLKGDVNSRFVQDLALKMFDKVPTTNSKVSVDVQAQLPEKTVN